MIRFTTNPSGTRSARVGPFHIVIQGTTPFVHVDGSTADLLREAGWEIDEHNLLRSDGSMPTAQNAEGRALADAADMASSLAAMLHEMARNWSTGPDFSAMSREQAGTWLQNHVDASNQAC